MTYRRPPSKPTQKQKDALKAFGIKPPPTFTSCASILRFILEYRWGNLDTPGKVAMVMSAQDKWIGKRVAVEDVSITGTVQYILCIPVSGYRDAKQCNYEMSPFVLRIIPDECCHQKPRNCAASRVSLIED